jgi:DUF971 family protein
MIRPTSIRKGGSSELLIAWADGHQGTYSLEHLREICPCAGCKGESVLLHESPPNPQVRNTPGRYDLVGIQQVGSYAIQLQWGDGHNTGIYSWEYLLLNCMCDACAAARGQQGA